VTFVVSNQRRPTIQEINKFRVGLDVHKDSISVAVAEPGRMAGRLVGKVVHDVSKLLKLLGKIGTSEQLHLVYEAGPTGFGLQRALIAKGYCCEIIAPSQIPRRAGDRVKTDERVERLTQSLQACITNWRFAPVVAALQALRGVALSARGLQVNKT